MNANAKLWVKALKSGDYTQTKKHLRDDSGYCCLGVACELYRKQTGQGDWTNGRVPGEFEFLEQPNALPGEVMNWLGLNTEDGRCFLRYVTTLAMLNDHGASFEKVAELIESNPPGLFKEAKDV